MPSISARIRSPSKLNNFFHISMNCFRQHPGCRLQMLRAVILNDDLVDDQTFCRISIRPYGQRLPILYRSPAPTPAQIVRARCSSAGTASCPEGIFISTHNIGHRDDQTDAIYVAAACCIRNCRFAARWFLRYLLAYQKDEVPDSYRQTLRSCGGARFV